MSAKNELPRSENFSSDRRIVLSSLPLPAKARAASTFFSLAIAMVGDVGQNSLMMYNHPFYKHKMHNYDYINQILSTELVLELFAFLA